MTVNFCDTCGHQYSDICGVCESLEGVPVKYRKKTHYDEVRAMSVGEMADWLGNIVQEWCSGTAEVNGKIIDSWLEWLEEEVEDA